MYVNIYVCIYIYKYIYICVCVCVCVCVHDEWLTVILHHSLILPVGPYPSWTFLLKWSRPKLLSIQRTADVYMCIYMYIYIDR